MNTLKLSFAAAIVAELDGCGGGQRALGNLPDVTVGPNGARVTQQSRDPRVPTY